jgi:hypothetical protein
MPTDEALLGNQTSCNSGACCLDCRRYVNGSLVRKARGIIIPDACPWCARVPDPPKPLIGE